MSLDFLDVSGSVGESGVSKIETGREHKKSQSIADAHAQLHRVDHLIQLPENVDFSGFEATGNRLSAGYLIRQVVLDIVKKDLFPFVASVVKYGFPESHLSVGFKRQKIQIGRIDSSDHPSETRWRTPTKTRRRKR